MVFDTNVIAYALLGVPEYRSEALQAITVAREIWAPESLRAELVNTVWQWVRLCGTPLETARDVLADTEIVVTHFVPLSLLWEDALEFAVDRDHPAYDTFFVALAAATGFKVVTYDEPLRKRFPEWTISVPKFLTAISEKTDT